jgi:4'-phosphopantetheinyl transferase
MEILIFDDMTQATEAEVQRLLPLVSAQRREQALRYKHTFGQFCCLKSWLMLYERLRVMGYGLQDWKYNEYGKPYVENGPYFSISHCKEGIAVAIDEQPIGIDIEGIRHADEELIERVMSEKEKLQITNHQSPMESARAFTRLWTQKEAIVKAQGTGIMSFEQLQKTLVESLKFKVESVEKEKYIYSIAQIGK